MHHEVEPYNLACNEDFAKNLPLSSIKPLISIIKNKNIGLKASQKSEKTRKKFKEQKIASYPSHDEVMVDESDGCS